MNSPRSWLRSVAVVAAFVIVSTVGFTMPHFMQTVRAERDPWPAQAQAPAPTRVFGADAGMIINTIKAEKTADFEMVIAKVKEALQKSENPQRKAQAASWRVFRSVEAGPNNSALYVFWIDPPVKDADYTVARILSEGFPADVQALYKTFNDSYAGGQNLLNLRLVSSLGQ
jgi:hypothetical protein